MSAKWIKSSGEIIEIVPENGTSFQLKELQKYVGGFIQVLNPTSQKEAVLIINEEGKMLDLPINSIATKIWQDKSLPGDYIVGDVILCLASQCR